MKGLHRVTGLFPFAKSLRKERETLVDTLETERAPIMPPGPNWVNQPRGRPNTAGSNRYRVPTPHPVTKKRAGDKLDAHDETHDEEGWEDEDSADEDPLDYPPSLPMGHHRDDSTRSISSPSRLQQQQHSGVDTVDDRRVTSSPYRLQQQENLPYAKDNGQNISSHPSRQSQSSYAMYQETGYAALHHRLRHRNTRIADNNHERRVETGYYSAHHSLPYQTTHALNISHARHETGYGSAHHSLPHQITHTGDISHDRYDRHDKEALCRNQRQRLRKYYDNCRAKVDHVEDRDEHDDSETYSYMKGPGSADSPAVKGDGTKPAPAVIQDVPQRKSVVVVHPAYPLPNCFSGEIINKPNRSGWVFECSGDEAGPSDWGYQYGMSDSGTLQPDSAKGFFDKYDEGVNDDDAGSSDWWLAYRARRSMGHAINHASEESVVEHHDDEDDDDDHGRVSGFDYWANAAGRNV
ncbi:hypothetical protein B0H66DRAFT_625729 [Apodospora peruviana]|uniref:Uncharacterized protein n=1 Tax=Apodospora peruviana TaxID=516989 RepID=A0AAE0I0U7_9PEZI|nr:hypothetical protein B0H66DRAFT_625729 [Apodospora peruviana]